VNPDSSRVILISNTDTFDSELIIRDGDVDVPLMIPRESVSTILL
jgi:O-glycosyl hydrolase